MHEGKKFYRQPVLSQILDLIPNDVVRIAVRNQKKNLYYKMLPL
jgi:hypothetical protein